MTSLQIAADLGQPEGFSSSDNGVWHLAPTALDAARGADAVLILTEWSEFADLDWHAISAGMRKPAWVFDARACIHQASARTAGLNVWTVGQG